MGAGHWLNPETGQCVQVATTHDEWVRDKANSQNLGLSQSVYEAIMQQPPTAIDEIRLLAVQAGLVRLREHRRYLSVQFYAPPDRVTPILGAVLGALTNLNVHPDTHLKIDNLMSNSVSMTLV